MSFHVYCSAARAKVEFKPLIPGKVSIYGCGATVQSAPHLGHVRKEVNFDVLRRWLTASGYEVTLVTNVTDIDDKILAKSTEAGRPWWAHAYLYEAAFARAFRALGVLPPTYEPRATGHIPEMIELMHTLIERGHAYATADGVYFDVRSWPAYGELSGMKLDELTSEDGDDHGKRDPRDFALWKAAKASEDPTASWNTPWGRGRPGWHLECSAMAGKYLGDAFDIHGGGIDLRFPHHENEIAQSKAAGRPFATYWMHNAWVTMAGEKMSKSLGNTADVESAVATYGGRAVRLYLAGPHYRSAIELSEESLADAATQLARIDSFLDRARSVASTSSAIGQTGAHDHSLSSPAAPPARSLSGPAAPPARSLSSPAEPPARSLSSPAEPGVSKGRPVPADFRAAMDDDLGTPSALAVIFGRVKDGNVALDAGDAASATAAYEDVLAMLDVFGLDPDAPEWASERGAGDDLTPVVDTLVATLLAQRAEARAAKDWAAADAIRDALAASGLKIEDTRDGARWSLVKE